MGVGGDLSQAGSEEWFFFLFCFVFLCFVHGDWRVHNCKRAVGRNAESRQRGVE